MTEINTINKGRIIYYDTRDGEPLLNTGYIENYNNKETIENYFVQLENQYGNRNYIDYKLLKYLEYDEEFKKFSHVRVTKDDELFFSNKETKYKIGLKHTMTDRWFPLFEKTSGIYNEETNVFDLDKLKYYYKDFIEYNLRNTCKFAGVYFLHPSEIDRMNKSNEKAIVRWDEDIFPSKEVFAREILKEGFIFPFQSKIKPDGKHYILDGSHRIVVCKQLVKDGLWDKDRRVLTIRFDTSNANFLERPDINYELNDIVKMHIPKQLIDKYHFIKYKDIREFDEYVYELDVYRYLDMVIVFRMYVTELTRPIKRYKDLTGKTLTPAKIMENEEMFNKWMNGFDIWN